MRALLDPLTTSVGRLKAELELYEVLSAALQNQYSADLHSLKEFDRRARSSTYTSTIVGSYGLIEQTVDSVLVALAESFERIYPKYGDLPESVRSAHRDVLLSCLRDGDRSRTSRQVDDREALHALGLQLDQPVALVGAAFTLSTANYRLPYTRMLFARMAVSILNEALALDAPKGALAKAGFADYESFLEDLVQRRNDLAHSYGDNDILSPDLLGTYVDIVDAYLRSLVRVATEAMVHRVVEQRLLQIGTVVKVWSGRLGVQLTGGYIEVGARLLITKDAWCTSHEVLSLQSEGVERDHFEWFDVDLNVSAAVREAANSAEGASAFIIGLEWRDYWPPETRPATQEQEQEQEQ